MLRSKYQKFIFEGYNFNKQAKVLSLRYSYDGQLKFEEQYKLDFDFTPNYSQKALEAALFGLFIMAGISYFKAYLAPEIVIKPDSLNEGQADFFNVVYQNGLGEFLYKNQLDPGLVASFPFNREGDNQPVEVNELSGNLLPVGGGKDSLVSAAILEVADEEFTTLRVNSNEWVDRQLELISHPVIKIKRAIAPKLIELNHKDALNGHVPPTAILSFLFVVCAVLTSKKTIILSNEASANQGSTTYKGLNINHQYSKSLEFELSFQKYLKEFISPSLEYFSLLRPLSELRIAELFIKCCFEKYKYAFSSCNQNFKLGSNPQKVHWCGKCAKCASVFGLLAPFTNKPRLIDLFNKNLFLDAKLKGTFNELLGIEGIKPFDCVGDIDEMRQALNLVKQSNDWPELRDWNIPKAELDYRSNETHAMPKRFSNMLAGFNPAAPVN
jgi:hypothetical protein